MTSLVARNSFRKRKTAISGVHGAVATNCRDVARNLLRRDKRRGHRLETVVLAGSRGRARPQKPETNGNFQLRQGDMHPCPPLTTPLMATHAPSEQRHSVRRIGALNTNSIYPFRKTAFAYIIPNVSNSLLLEIKSYNSYQTFKPRLKTIYFNYCPKPYLNQCSICQKNSWGRRWRALKVRGSSHKALITIAI